VSGVIVAVTLSLAKNLVRVAVTGFFPVLTVLVFDPVGVPGKAFIFLLHQFKNLKMKTAQMSI